MCYSAGASFAVGAALLGVGAVTIRSARSSQEVPLACIPVVFGIQQVSEGLVWRDVDVAGASTSTAAITVFLFVALFLWPTYIPVATWLVEPSRRRRRAIALLGVFGVALSAYLMAAVVGHDVTATAEDRRLVYDLPVFPVGVNVLPYIVVACSPLLLSSLRSLNAFGVMALVTSIASYELYSRAFVSVWCFMAAIVSVVVMAHFLRPQGIGQRVRTSAT